MIKESISLNRWLALWLSIGCVSAQVASAKVGQNQNPSSPPAAAWQRYTVKDEEFSVLLPTVPAMTTLTRGMWLTEERRERTIGAYANGVVYAIDTFEYKSAAPPLEDFAATFGAPVERFKRELNVGKFRGKEYTFQSDDVKGVTQIYFSEKSIYVFRVTGSSLGDIDAAIPKFLNSIKLEKNPEGVELVDGPGVQQAAQPKTEEIIGGKLMTRKARVITKPEPRYTEQARQNEIQGTVVIRCVFSLDGTVTNLHVVSGLPDGLNERALGAARQIRFVPAVKDGRFVSMWIELQYNFNLY